MDLSAFPLGVLGELDLQIFQRRRQSLRKGRIEGLKLAQEDRQRPAVMHEMMLALNQDVIVLREPE